MRTGDNKKDSVFSNLLNKFIKKDNNNKSSKNVDVNMHDVSSKKKASELSKDDEEINKPSSNNEVNSNSTGASKSLEIIKQKRMNRMSMIDINSNLSKKLASDNLDYDPVFK